MEKEEIKLCLLCNVPLDVHGTCCGWNNAIHKCSASGIITDLRHPGFGKDLNHWRNTKEDQKTMTK